MGYSHTWTQTRSFTADEWAEVSGHIREVLGYVENMLGVPLANGAGEGGTRPGFTDQSISFNGVEDDAAETFRISRALDKADPGDYCKTYRRPYDIAATACLCYLSSVSATHDVEGDGRGHEFVPGLEAAREALPAKANILDLPMGVLRKDRWTGPWINAMPASGYDVEFCINGRGYVFHRKSGQTWSAPREELARLLDGTKRTTFRTGGSTGWGSYGREEPNIWNAMGSFDQARHARIARAQAKVLAKLFPVDLEHSEPPPAYVRPNEMPRPEQVGEFCYGLEDLLKKIAA